MTSLDVSFAAQDSVFTHFLPKGSSLTPMCQQQCHLPRPGALTQCAVGPPRASGKEALGASTRGTRTRGHRLPRARLCLNGLC